MQTSRAQLLKAHYLGSNAEAIRHRTASIETRLTAGVQKQQERRAQQPERERVNVHGMKKEEEADLGHQNKPRADTGSRQFLHRDSPGCKHRGRTPIQPVNPGLSRACDSCGDTCAASARTRCGAAGTWHGTAFASANMAGSGCGELGLLSHQQTFPSKSVHGGTKTGLCIPSTSVPKGCHIHPLPSNLMARARTEPRLSEQAPESRAHETSLGCPQTAVAPGVGMLTAGCTITFTQVSHLNAHRDDGLQKVLKTTVAQHVSDSAGVLQVPFSSRGVLAHGNPSTALLSPLQRRTLGTSLQPQLQSDMPRSSQHIPLSSGQRAPATKGTF